MGHTLAFKSLRRVRPGTLTFKDQTPVDNDGVRSFRMLPTWISCLMGLAFQLLTGPFQWLELQFQAFK